MNTIRILQAFIISSLLFFCSVASARDHEHENHWDDTHSIKVMTQNQYPGADLAPLLTASNATEFNVALVSVLKKIAASRFHDRVQRQVAQIAKYHPHVVALQEAWRFDCTDLGPPTADKGCNDPEIAGAFVDQLKETLSALKIQGVHYKAVASVKNLDVSVVQLPNLPAGIPFYINDVPALLKTIDRDAILVRSDVNARAVNFKKVCPAKISLDGCNYQKVVIAQIPGPVEPIYLPIERGFVAADVKVGDKNYRVVNTHLELREPDPANPLSRFYQTAQASELITTLKTTTPRGKSLLLLGDMNSSPDDTESNGMVPPYEQFVEAGYIDGWLQTVQYTPGYTCCQDEELLNKQSKLYERIDLVFSRQQPQWVKDIHIVGIRPWDKTLPSTGPRLWPSDHGGVSAELRFW
jgi:endonuclease/exonuclease/phosphatase family metal-dependent hydrolase